MADPVADFLAREQDELAGIDDDLAPAAAPAEAPATNGVTDGEADFFGGGAVDAPVSAGDAPQELSNGIEAMDLNGAAGDVSEEPSGPQYNITIPREEPEKIKRWREEQKKRLDEKDAEEAVKISDMKQQAKKELEEFNKSRVEQLEKSKKGNREAEAEFLQERDSEKPGKEWERIANMCEFNPKQSKNTKDVSRMRSLLLQMKVQK